MKYDPAVLTIGIWLILTNITGFWPAFALDLCGDRQELSAEEAFDCGLSNYMVLGPERDAAAAAKWFRLAAENGDPRAANNLGQMYLAGDGVPKSQEDGLNWLLAAANGGSSKAMYSLGLHYEKSNLAEAASWFEEASEKGHAQAQNIFGNMLRFGYGVPTDGQRAAEFYRFAAEQGNAIAAYNLASMYLHDVGVAEDLREAYKWLFIAGARSDRSLRLIALEARSIVEELLTPTELETAIKQIRTWRPKSRLDRLSEQLP